MKLNGLTSLANDIDGMYTKEICPLRRKMSLGEGSKLDFASFVGETELMIKPLIPSFL